MNRIFVVKETRFISLRYLLVEMSNTCASLQNLPIDGT